VNGQVLLGPMDRNPPTRPIPLVRKMDANEAVFKKILDDF